MAKNHVESNIKHKTIIIDVETVKILEDIQRYARKYLGLNLSYNKCIKFLAANNYAHNTKIKKDVIEEHLLRKRANEMETF